MKSRTVRSFLAGSVGGTSPVLASLVPGVIVICHWDRGETHSGLLWGREHFQGNSPRGL